MIMVIVIMIIKTIGMKVGDIMDEQRLKESMLEDDNIEIDLSELIHGFLKILKDYWGLFLGTIVICTIAFSTFRYLTYTPIYRCEATFTVATDSENTGSYSYYYSQNTADQLSKTFPYILDSSYFRSILLEELGVNSLNGTLSASTVSESNIVTMSVESNSPQDAMSILTSAIEIYPDVARFVLGQIQFHMINNPQLPTDPYNKLTFTNTVLVGGIIGLVSGTIILGCMALFRKTVKNPEDMKRITNLNCMATIPRVKIKARKIHKQTRISINDRRIPFAFKENMRSLQMRLERVFKKEEHKVIVVTSTAANEGKTTLTINLAETFATNGKRVLLIDADLRRQSIASILHCKDNQGLIDVYLQKGDVLKNIRKLDDSKLWFIGNDNPVDNPVSVLSHPDLKEFIEKMKKEFDYVIIDTPPCGIFQDVTLIQKYADALLYVVKYDFLPYQKIQNGLSILKEDCCFMGYVFNIYTKKSSEYGHHSYGYNRYGYVKDEYKE